MQFIEYQQFIKIEFRRKIRGKREKDGGKAKAKAVTYFR